MNLTLVLIVLFGACSGLARAAEIYDPLYVFCGTENCYDILGVDRYAEMKTIKKAYRKISLTEHPDKSKAENATQVFQRITKAFDVLAGNESRKLFDYYLDHPKDYFTVSGSHYIYIFPKSDVRVILTAVLLLLSWFFHTIQYQKYERAVKYLKTATLNNLSLKNGGSKQTMELYRRATELFDTKVKQLKATGDKTAGKTKMIKDPLFEKCVDELVAEVKIEGGYRKPVWQDLVIVKFCMLPVTLYHWGATYHRRYLSNTPLSLEDKREMARDRVGLATWENMSEEDQNKLLDRKIWESVQYEAWIEELKELEAKRLAKLGKGARKKKALQQAYEEEEDEDYIE